MQIKDISEVDQATFDNFWKNFVLPDIDRRLQLGELERPIDIKAFQIIFYCDGRAPSVRINTEVKAYLEIPKEDIKGKKNNDRVYQSEIRNIRGIRLHKKDDDFGHATYIKIDEQKYFGCFSFQYNRGTIGRYKNKANEFLLTAEYAYTNKFWSSFIDNLYSAAEIIAKAIIVGLSTWKNYDPAIQIIDKKQKIDKIKDNNISHDFVKEMLNYFSKFKIIEKEQKDLLNILSNIRADAKYKNSDYQLDVNIANDYLTKAKSMFNGIELYCDNP